jgi:hypothetical protein
MKWLGKMLLVAAFVPAAASAQQRANANLKRIYFNLYTDSIKTILDFYVNVEGEYQDGRFLPLDTSQVVFSADHGTMRGNDWKAPAHIDFEKVHFDVHAKDRPELHDSITVWLKRTRDPRDYE